MHSQKKVGLSIFLSGYYCSLAIVQPVNLNYGVGALANTSVMPAKKPIMPKTKKVDKPKDYTPRPWDEEFGD